MEKRQNYSRKREAILSAICSTDIHPTADWIYQKLTPFKEDGLIISVGVVEGQERLDGTTAPHAHFICSKCGCVLDVEDVEQDAQLDFDVSKRIRCQIDSHDLVFHGICEECLNSQKNAG